jgi:hypothetical protein
VLSVDRPDDVWAAGTYRSSPKQQYGVEERGRSKTSHNGTAPCAESGGLNGSGQNVPRTSGRHGTHRKSKSEYLNRKAVPVASPEADDEDEDYYCGRNSTRGHTLLDDYYRETFKPTVGTTPSRNQWDYRKGVS